VVTQAEFFEHLLWSGGIMVVALGVAAYVRYRYDAEHKNFRRIAIWFVVSLAAVAGLSLTADVTETRCTRDPSEFCRYNNNIPFIATVVTLYVAITLGRAFFMHFNR
jgi:beta-lactamase regulating signal transducer with metallopeptidase domain